MVRLAIKIVQQILQGFLRVSENFETLWILSVKDHLQESAADELKSCR